MRNSNRGAHNSAYVLEISRRDIAIETLSLAKMQEEEKEELVKQGLLKKTIIIVDNRTKKIHYERI